ncbi:unnamed protein product [Jaminaea pallidilutea]
MAGAPHASQSSSSTSGNAKYYRPMYNFHPHRPALKHRIGARVMGGAMFFFILFRAKQDLPVLLGWRHPWEGHGDHHGDDHGHGHGHH